MPEADMNSPAQQHGRPSLSGPDLDAIRRKPAYRAGIWLARFNLLPLFAWFYLLWAGGDGWPVLGTWILLVVLILAGLALFAKAGALVRRGPSFTSVDPRLNAEMYKDFFRLR